MVTTFIRMMCNSTQLLSLNDLSAFRLVIISNVYELHSLNTFRISILISNNIPSCNHIPFSLTLLNLIRPLCLGRCDGPIVCCLYLDCEYMGWSDLTGLQGGNDSLKRNWFGRDSYSYVVFLHESIFK